MPDLVVSCRDGNAVQVAELHGQDIEDAGRGDPDFGQTPLP